MAVDGVGMSQPVVSRYSKNFVLHGLNCKMECTADHDQSYNGKITQLLFTFKFQAFRDFRQYMPV